MILVAFGDMLRVPANVPKREPRSLEQARAAGGDVRPIASPQEAVKIARANPGPRGGVLRRRLRDDDRAGRRAVAEGLPANLSILLSGRLTWPAVAMLLDSEEAGLRRADRAGPRLDDHGAGGMALRAGATTAFRPPSPASRRDSLLAALYSVLRQRLEGHGLSRQLLCATSPSPAAIRPRGG